MRRTLDELDPVDGEEWIVRLIHHSWYDYSAPVGSKVKTSALQSKELYPTAESYGPSVFAPSKLANGIDTLDLVDPKWATRGIARVQVKQLRALGIEVVWSPEDCRDPELVNAHISLVGCNSANRDAAVDLFAAHVEREPKRP